MTPTTSLLDRANLDRDAVRHQLGRGLAGADVTAKSDIYSFGLVLAEALLGRPIDMAGSQAELIDKRRVVPAELAWVEPTMRPLLQAMLQPLPENRPTSMAEVAAWEPDDRGGRRSALDERPSVPCDP